MTTTKIQATTRSVHVLKRPQSNFPSSSPASLSRPNFNTTTLLFVASNRRHYRYAIYFDKQASKLVVHIHELTSWTKDQDTPDDVDDFLELIHLVADWEYSQMMQRQRKRQASTSSSKDGSKLRQVAVMCL